MYFIIVSASLLGRQTNYTRSVNVSLTIILFTCTIIIGFKLFYGTCSFCKSYRLNWSISVNSYLHRKSTIIHSRWRTLHGNVALFSAYHIYLWLMTTWLYQILAKLNFWKQVSSQILIFSNVYCILEITNTGQWKPKPLIQASKVLSILVPIYFLRKSK